MLYVCVAAPVDNDNGCQSWNRMAENKENLHAKMAVSHVRQKAINDASRGEGNSRSRRVLRELKRLFRHT